MAGRLAVACACAPMLVSAHNPQTAQLMYSVHDLCSYAGQCTQTTTSPSDVLSARPVFLCWSVHNPQQAHLMYSVHDLYFSCCSTVWWFCIMLAYVCLPGAVQHCDSIKWCAAALLDDGLLDVAYIMNYLGQCNTVMPPSGVLLQCWMMDCWMWPIS